jgi:hypothetical protein
MAKFMDIHRGMNDISPEALAEAHDADLALQDGEGVEFTHAWADPETGTVFCLSTGPNVAAVQRVHELAGHPADEYHAIGVEV